MAASPTLAEEQGSQWSADQLHLIDWLATPQQHRKPDSQTALAAQVGVRPATLSNWKRLDGFALAVRQACRSLVADTWLVDVYHAMYKEALAGSVAAARLLMEVAGELDQAQAGPVDRRVQFLIMAPGSTALPELAAGDAAEATVVPAAAPELYPERDSLADAVEGEAVDPTAARRGKTHAELRAIRSAKRTERAARLAAERTTT